MRQNRKSNHSINSAQGSESSHISGSSHPCAVKIQVRNHLKNRPHPCAMTRMITVHVTFRGVSRVKKGLSTVLATLHCFVTLQKFGGSAYQLKFANVLQAAASSACDIEHLIPVCFQPLLACRRYPQTLDLHLTCRSDPGVDTCVSSVLATCHCVIPLQTFASRTPNTLVLFQVLPQAGAETAGGLVWAR